MSKSVEEAEAIIQNKMQDVKAQMSDHDHFNRYILSTLDNFAYRYFDDARPAECLNENSMHVVAVEAGIKNAIKIKNQKLRDGIGELVKRVSKEQGPTIARELRVDILNRTPGKGGKAHVHARISWGHPEHTFEKSTCVEKLSVLEFEDDMFLRNHLAKNLEEVCELFE